MKTLTDILNEMAKVDDVLKRIADDFKYFRPPGLPGYGDIQGPNINVARREVRYDVRHLGKWQLPSHVDPHSTEAEDYDWEEWAPGEYKKYLKFFKEWIKSKSWANLVKDFSINGSEKNWVSFQIVVKDRLFIKQPGVQARPELGMDWDRRY